MKKFRLFPKEEGYIPHLWLLYFYYSCLYLLNIEGFCFLFTLLILVAVFICYRETYWRPERTFAASMIMTLLIAFLVFFVSASYFYLLLYATSMLYGLQKPWKFWLGYAAINSVAVCLLLVDILGLTNIIWGYLLPGILIGLITPAAWKAQETWNRKWEAVNQELSEANNRVEELIKERERDRIARDLHDTVGQTLSTISVKSDISKKLLYQNPERAEQELHDIQLLARSLLKEMREIVSDLRLVSLQEEVESAHDRLQEAGIDFELVQQFPSIRDSSKETLLAYIVKEAVTNVIRHSNATSCKIRVIQSDSELQLEVEDNGSFDGREWQEGNGVDGIRKRVRLMKGRVHFKKRQNSGLRLTIHVPMQTEGGTKYDSYAVGG
ncbi:two-component system, NarL family, sensor histidine kinase DesK [Terribacillus halophilus]|uniref:histidine kinase n=1 Tax=Terribacillus halophilus TaxID=361279 RepID=A0A1G6NPA7_9BACI|nr:sensor histidine kinase [Terribacillus halophilus]SDC69491.1 two-component system, NarL family, sensor histidine kinase DesK [Terribacillus halophilus]